MTIPVTLVIAVDHGARAAIEALGAYRHFHVIEFDAARAAQEAYWTSVIAAAATRLAVIGTSDSGPGRAIEIAARRAAVRHSIPVVAIEDYPGNYSHVPDAATRLLVVESELAQAVHRDQLGTDCPEILIHPAIRYDVYRKCLPVLRAGTIDKWQLEKDNSIILWAGQPETGDAVVTLERLIPHLQAHRVRLLFKAHPRDAGYAAGAYMKLFEVAGLDYSDVTPLSVADALALAPRLVVTQFSSVAVEAGFYGIPSLHVLLPNVGGARLRRKKGYAVPPFCMAGAAAYVSDEKTLAATFSSALLEPRFRQELMNCFDIYFSARKAALPGLVETLNALAGRA